MKTLLLFLLVSACSSSQISTRVLAKGTIYNWKISQMTDQGKTAIFFTLDSAVTKKAPTGFYIGIMTSDELRYFIDELRLFASYTDTLDRQQRYDSFEILLEGVTGKITLIGTNYIILSKSNAKALATDIEKSISLMR